MTHPIQTYRIKVSDLVMCTIHQDAFNGDILDVVFTADDGKGCPVTSTIGSLEGVSIDSIRKATTHSIDIVENWEEKQDTPTKKDVSFSRLPMLQTIESWRFAMAHALLLHGQARSEYICSVVELLQGFVNEHKKDGEKLI